MDRLSLTATPARTLSQRVGYPVLGPLGVDAHSGKVLSVSSSILNISLPACLPGFAGQSVCEHTGEIAAFALLQMPSKTNSQRTATRATH